MPLSGIYNEVTHVGRRGEGREEKLVVMILFPVNYSTRVDWNRSL